MKKYLAAFGAFPNMRNDYWRKLAGYFPDFKQAWEGTPADFMKAGLSEKWIHNFCEHRSQTNPAAVLRRLEEFDIKLLPFFDEGYPPFLKEIYSPPFLLYQKGDYSPIDGERAIGIVGSRKGTDYGRRVTYEIAKDLARAGITIVSGLAIGLDTEAHKGALAGGGRTIAVLANGLERFYPSSNTALANQIIQNGCIFSEQPIGMPPLKQNFPARNRIISGLAQGILITEAGEGSGTLHTASFAIEQNRQIYAIPGPIYNPLAKGPNDLLKRGAKPVTEASDILEDFGIETTHDIIVPEGKDEQMIFEALGDENLHIDDLVRRTERSSGEISKILTLMEIKGKIRHLGGMVYGLK